MRPRLVLLLTIGFLVTLAACDSDSEPGPDSSVPADTGEAGQDEHGDDSSSADAEADTTEACCCEYLTGDIINEDLLPVAECEALSGQCITVDPMRLTPHPCCPEATGERCGD